MGRAVRPPAAVLAGLLLLAAGACGQTASPVASPSALSPTATRAMPSSPPSSSGPPSVATQAPGSGSAVQIDRSLLDVLPDTVDGVPIEFSAEASGETVRNGSLPPEIEALAFGIAPTPGGDIVVVSVVRLRPDAFDEPFFRDWRSTYVDGVCAPAGGPAPGVAEVELGGRNVHIGSCVNGGHTYMTWLEDRRLLVSAFALGERRLGEQLMETLEE